MHCSLPRMGPCRRKAVSGLGLGHMGGWVCVCVLLTWGRRWHQDTLWKKAGRSEAGVGGNVLMGETLGPADLVAL